MDYAVALNLYAPSASTGESSTNVNTAQEILLMS